MSAIEFDRFEVFGNPKANFTTPEHITDWAQKMDKEFKERPFRGNRVRMILFAPTGLLDRLNRLTDELPELRNARQKGIFAIGVQGLSPHSPGDFTGANMAQTAKSLGAEFGILGHSDERYKWPYVTDAIIREQILRSHDVGLTPVLCVGPTPEEEASGKTDNVLRRQLAILKGTPFNGAVVFEPLSSILAQGKAAKPPPTSEEILGISQTIRKMTDNLGVTPDIGYGGGVGPDTADGVFGVVNVVLPGTASRFPDKWRAIAAAAESRLK